MGSRKHQVDLLFMHDELIVDNFAGGGGASTGIERALNRAVDIAVNHDREAVAMHAKNHPQTHHYCEDVFKVKPLVVTQGKPVMLAWFSPDCKHFSKAKGGTPVSKKIRGLAWVVTKWAATVKPRVIALENVEEFKDWGPLRQRTWPDGSPMHDLHGKPVMEPNPKRKGETFRRWWAELERLGYKVEARQLRACDFGAPTIRKRLFIIARRDGKPIVWPEPTHRDPKKPGPLPVWRTAAECIDWSIECPSIFTRRKPLAEATMKRIARGLERYVLFAQDPFIVQLSHGEGKPGGAQRWGSGARSMSDPLNTVTGSGGVGVVAPLFTEFANASTQRNMPADEPLRTICAQVKGGHHALVTPMLVNTANSKTTGRGPNVWAADSQVRTITSAGGAALATPVMVNLTHQGGDRTEDVREPIKTVTGAKRGEKALAVPLMVQTGYGEREGQAPRALDLGKPLGTVVAGAAKHALANAYIVKHFGDQFGGRKAADLREPLPTTTARACQNQVVTAQLVGVGGRAGQSRARTVAEPTATLTAKADNALVASNLVKLRNNQTAQELEAPIPTLTAGGGHAALSNAYLVKFYSEGGQHAEPRDPMHTIPTKDRMGLVQVHSVPMPDLSREQLQSAAKVARMLRKYLPDLFKVPKGIKAPQLVIIGDYVLVDIGMRMLVPRELYKAQGFPDDYLIDFSENGAPLTKTAQVRMCGNSVCPPVAEALVRANFADEIRAKLPRRRTRKAA